MIHIYILNKAQAVSTEHEVPIIHKQRITKFFDLVRNCVQVSKLGGQIWSHPLPVTKRSVILHSSFWRMYLLGEG